MRILAIETSCDETAACLLEAESSRLHIQSNVLSSQIETHKKYGGIIPEVAARMQMEAIIPAINEALSTVISNKGSRSIDCIAVTQGPGLVTSLRVGVQTAKTLAYAWKKPLVAVNHIEGHVLSALLPEPRSHSNPAVEGKESSEASSHIRPYSLDPSSRQVETQDDIIRDYQFPALALIVSGKHSDLILIKDYGVYGLVGRTRDDAAGEAFDKVAKLLGLRYPGGPEISRLATEGNPSAFHFPRPMVDSDDFDFSFSGLKTAVLYTLRDMFPGCGRVGMQHTTFDITDTILRDICASFQLAVIDTLVTKTMRAAEKYNVKSVILGGGVSANKLLRDTLEKHCQRKSLIFHLPFLSYTTDNAAMIAAAGYYKALRNEYADWHTLTADPHLTLV